MKSLFKAAKCANCGGPLNVANLSCPFCGTNYRINWNSMRASDVEVQKLPFRDETVDAILLAMLQAEADNDQVEIELSTDSGQGKTAIIVLVKDLKFDTWLEAGKIIAYRYAEPYRYLILANDDLLYDPGLKVTYQLSWRKLLKDEREYRILRDYHPHRYPQQATILLGNDALFESLELRLAMLKMVWRAGQLKRFEEEMRQKQTEWNQLPPVKRFINSLFGKNAFSI